MKNYNSLLFAFVATIFIFFTACKSDGFDFTLSYDGTNVTAPEFLEGTYESGALFPAGFNGNDGGNELVEIEYFIRQLPRTAELRVYTGGNDQPEQLVYSKSVLTEINQESWNSHILEEPLTLDGDDLWIMLSYQQTGTARTLGCDAGPADENGDWHYDSYFNEWLPLNEQTDIDINWNIRAKVNVPAE